MQFSILRAFLGTLAAVLLLGACSHPQLAPLPFAMGKLAECCAGDVAQSQSVDYGICPVPRLVHRIEPPGCQPDVLVDAERVHHVGRPRSGPAARKSWLPFLVRLAQMLRHPDLRTNCATDWETAIELGQSEPGKFHRAPSANQQKRDDGHTNTDTDSEKSPSEWQEKKNGNGDPEDQACDYQHDHFRVRQAPENDRLFNEPVWDEVDFSTLHTDLFH